MSLAAVLSSSPFAVALLLFKLGALAALVLWAIVRLAHTRAEAQRASDLPGNP